MKNFKPVFPNSNLFVAATPVTLTHSRGFCPQKLLFLLLCFFVLLAPRLQAQNVGIGTTTPEGKLHIKGSADTTQLIIDANSIQSHTDPLIKLRNSSGIDLMWIHSDNPYNTFIGVNAGRVNIAGSGGIYNGFIGGQAGYSNTTGYSNTANGVSALYSNTTGFRNTADGSNALWSNVAGVAGVAIGYYSQFYANNTATTWDNTNTSVGYQSLRGSINPADNIGTSNTAIGRDALFSNSSGNYNTANGQSALFSNTTGFQNTAIGFEALRNNISGINNTANGFEALLSNTIGQGNTALGLAAGVYYTNNNYNTFIGCNTNANANGYSNSTALGNNAETTASNQVRIGSGVISIGGPQDWTNTSDGRIKLNIRDDVPGLAFIKLLHPVTYNKSIKLEDEIIGRKDKKELLVDNAYENMRYTGFIAQEVEAAAKKLGYDFSGVDAPKNEKDLYGLRYAEFVVPLVKAVQELEQMIKEQKDEIELLKKSNENLKSDNASMKSDLEKIKVQLKL